MKFANNNASYHEDHLDALAEALNNDEIVDFLLYLNNNSSCGEDHSVDQKNGADEEVERRLPEYIKNKQFDQAGKKTEMPLWLNVEEKLSSYKKVGVRNWNLSSIWSDFQCGFGECPPNHFTTLAGSRLPITWAKKDNQRSITRNMLSQLDNNEVHCSIRNSSREAEFQHDSTYEYNHHIKEIVQCLSSFVLSTVVFLGISYNIWNSQLLIIHVQRLHKEHSAHLSILPPFLTFFGFMVFVCAVAAMILLRAPFTCMQKAMLIFWALLLHLQSANSIIEVFVTLVGGLYLGWYSFVGQK